MDSVTGTCDDCGAEGVPICLTEYNWQCAKCKGEPSEDTDAEITPSMAIRSVTSDLRFRKSEWIEKGHDDPNGLVSHMEKHIAALELAQWELGEYRKLKAALATLRAAMP